MFKFKAVHALASAVVSSVAVPALADPVQFAVQYTDGASEGFNDPILGTARKDAFSYALDQWSSVLVASFSGETINVVAGFNPVGGMPDSATLASAGPASFYNLNIIPSGLWVPTALTNHLIQGQADANPEIIASFNTDVDGVFVLGDTDFYYGTDQSAGSDVDFVSVAMHEIAHGLGFNSSLRSTTGQYDLDSNGTVDDPTIYDFFLANAAGTQLINMTPSQRMSAIMSNSLFWAGEEATIANGGAFPKIYAPTTFIQGSSVSHLDETVHQFDLLSPSYSGPEHEISAIARGMLSDMLWDVTPIPEPGAASLLLIGGTMALFNRLAEAERGVIVGILSDTHDRLDAARAAIAILQQNGAEYFMHCGDVGSEPILDLLAGLPSAFVFGNNDWDRRTLERYAAGIHVSCLGDGGDLELGGKLFHVEHGDNERALLRAIDSQKFDYVLHGHSHVQRDERVGKTHVINPGALHRAKEKTVALLDTEKDALRFLIVYA